MQQVKDQVLSLKQLGSLLWCGFDPYPENFCMLWMWQKKKKKKKEKKEKRKRKEQRKLEHNEISTMMV